MGKRSESRILQTAGEVSAAFGGPAGLSELTGAPYKRCWDWTEGGRFPSRYFLLMTEGLRKRGLRASPALWGQVTSPEVERAVA
jgi:hypothetical protein